MSIENILIWIFGIGVSGGLLYTSLNLIGANVYDLLAIKRAAKLKKHPYSKPNRHRPLISIIIPVHNEALVIERCLRSLLSSTYRKFEVIVADDASNDDTVKIVEGFIKKYPRYSIKIAKRRRNGGRGAAIDAGLKKSRGELIMALDADCVIDRFALKNTVRHFADPSVAAVAMNVRIMQTDRTIGLLQMFDYILSFRTKKFNTVTNSEHIIGGAGATYRHDVLTKLGGFDHSMQTEDIEMSLRIARMLGHRDYKLKYASDVLIFTEPVPSYRSLFRQRLRWKFGSLQALYLHKQIVFSLRRKHSKILAWVRLPFALWSEMMLLFEPFFFTYFLYLAVHNNNPALFIIACVTITAIMLMAIWSDEHLSLKNRLTLSLYAPMMYLVMYVLTAIQVLAFLKCLLRINGIAGKEKISGAYVSPERIGGLEVEAQSA